jgi:hypothetical protein
VKLTPICIAALLLAGCSKNIDTPEAVREGVIKDIASKVDVKNMDVTVDSVSFRDKEADAKVSFKPKGAAASQSMTMNYSMERQGDVWHIKGREMQGGHGAQGQPGAPGQPALPTGHPGITPGSVPGGQPAPAPGQHGFTPAITPGATPGAAGAPLPAGHPQVDTTKKP